MLTMKKKTTFLLILLTSLCMCRCTTPGETEEHYLKVNYSALSFLSSGNSPVVVTVEAFPQKWNAESLDPWLKIPEQTSETLTVMTDDYEGVEDRQGSVKIKAGDMECFIKVQQIGKESPVSAKFRLIEEFFSAAISPNGKYFGGFYTESSDSAPSYYPVIYDVTTDERTVLGPYPKSLFHLMDAMAINDQGILYIDEGNEGGVVCFTLDGQSYRSGKPQGFSRNMVVAATSLGGRVMVGWCAGSPEDHTYGPVKCVDGEYFALPLPDKNYRNEEFSAGILARGVSANGEIIYGTTWENYDDGMVYWDKEGNVHYVGEDVRYVREVDMQDGLGEPIKYTLVDGIASTAGANYISPDGKWLAGIFRTETVADNQKDITNTYCPAFFNTETEKTILLEDYSGYGACGVTNDGIGFLSSTSGFGGGGPVVDILNGTKIYDSFSDYMKDKFGIIVPNGVQLEYMCHDGNVLMGSKTIMRDTGPDVYYWYSALCDGVQPE